MQDKIIDLRVAEKLPRIKKQVAGNWHTDVAHLGDIWVIRLHACVCVCEFSVHARWVKCESIAECAHYKATLSKDDGRPGSTCSQNGL